MLKGTKGLFIMLGAVVAFILLLGSLVKNNPGNKTSLSNLKTIKVGNTSVNVTIANDDATRSKGLGGINSLPANQGMLFDFGTKNIAPQNARFWMKGMLIPLDFIWIANNKVVEITPNIANPAPNTPDNQLLIYQPSESVDFVLEVNAGFAMRNNIKVGDQSLLTQ